MQQGLNNLSQQFCSERVELDVLWVDFARMRCLISGCVRPHIHVRPSSGATLRHRLSVIWRAQRTRRKASMTSCSALEEWRRLG